MNMGINKVVFGVSAGILVLVGVLYTTLEDKVVEETASIPATDTDSKLAVEKTWELPQDLSEISGVAYLGNQQVAGVQDEDGKIFIYNLSTAKIEKEIDFAGGGDYEGIAVQESTAYVVRSDGTIFKVKNYLEEPQIEEISTFLSTTNDVEGLCYDPKNNRLLVAVKEKDPNSKNTKGIYAFDLDSSKLLKEPVYELNFEEEFYNDIRKKNRYETYWPSEINIHPSTGEIYVLEGKTPRLLILNPDGSPKQLLALDKKTFPQPEGITFDEAGNTYISSEGDPGTLNKIAIK